MGGENVIKLICPFCGSDEIGVEGNEYELTIINY